MVAMDPHTGSESQRRRSGAWADPERRINCWEFMGCGREPGGEHAKELGICPAAVDMESHGINHGVAAGRFCWTVAEVPCSTSLAAKFKKCLTCPFFGEVERQEGRFLVLRRIEARGVG